MTAPSRSASRSPWVVRAFAALGLALLVLGSPVQAQAGEVEGGEVDLAIDMDYRHVRVGDTIRFNTTVQNVGEDALDVVVAMNIVNLGDGRPVDPEDWSPRRAQSTDGVAPGANATHAWVVNAIIEGDYMVYLVAIPQPGAINATTQAVSSSGIHLTVDPFVRLNPGGILPWSVGMPFALGGVWLGIRRWRLGQLDLDLAEDAGHA